MSVRRIFSEKKPGFDVEAQALLHDLHTTLGIDSLRSLRLLQRYDVEGLDAAAFAAAARTIFSEPNADNLGDDLSALGVDENAFLFAVEYLPGQFDQRADSAAQCIALLGGERPLVRSARVYVLTGELTSAQREKIKAYLINPVEAREAAFEMPATLALDTPEAEDVPVLTGFTAWTDALVADYHAAHGFAMTSADLCFCRDYFASEKRDPTETELRVIDTYWSDHCRHTTFSTRLASVEFAEDALIAPIKKAWLAYLALREEVYGARQKDVTLMDIATLGAKALRRRGLCDDVEISYEINACSITATVHVDGAPQEWLVQFKNETHNHPTEIEPFGGAATCLGGAIRDPLSGRSYVYQAMRVTGAGDPTVPFSETLPGKLPQRKITLGAAQGYSAYGNQIGLATGQVTEIYDRAFLAKRMEIGAVIAASPRANVLRGVPQPDDVILMLGGRTGRDGCGGATGSSKAHSTESIETCGAEVQKGNAPTERALQRLFRNPAAAQKIQRCNDFGAGGVCVAIGELAPGLVIELDSVRKKYDGLGGTELAISESQERMAVVVRPADAEAFTALADAENLECVPVATVVAGDREYESDPSARLVMHWRGQEIVNLARTFLDTNGVTGRAEVRFTAPDAKADYRTIVPEELAGLSLADALERNLTRLNVAAQKGLAERFDASIGAGTVLMPFAGLGQLTPEDVAAAKIPLEVGETDDATLLSYGFSAGLAHWSPFHGAAYAVTISLAKIAAAGGDSARARLTFQEYFPRLREDATRWGLPTAALLGALGAQMGFGTPAIGGKDSMSGSFEELDVPPTLVSFAVGLTKASQIQSSAFLPQHAGRTVYKIPLPVDKKTLLPQYDKAAELFALVSQLVQNGGTAAVVGEGGVAGTLCQKCFGSALGFRFAPATAQALFAPELGALLVTFDDAVAHEWDAFNPIPIGTLTAEDSFRIDDQRIAGEQLRRAWLGKLAGVFPTAAKDADMPLDIPLSPAGARRTRSPKVAAIAQPRVLIPVFPGTNCEVDTARAFARAGAKPQILVLRNRTPAQVEESVRALAAALGTAQILMLPGGFSAGDEPEGSGKFIATFLRAPRVQAAVMELLGQRDGLALGICNGFQALIKTGLLPYGEIRDTLPGDPTLTFNNIGRHVSQMVTTRVVQNRSPWLAQVQPGELHCVPVSHGEGRFVADLPTLEKLIAGGQIATQYVDASGIPAAAMPWNPNGSVCAIEGITSPDGRVLGKMAHSERRGADVCKNVPGEKDMRLFESGAGYFK
ncbi:MAG: phosphoribosylformylglycinamidine synthase [Oscillospiraceae bacterium]|jgi:phosphoribosylformylglycinamidine synthase|nr:phosphoribosylformylglycinamidine synthase [Oscillospiraceae bacterium]